MKPSFNLRDYLIISALLQKNPGKDRSNFED